MLKDECIIFLLNHVPVLGFSISMNDTNIYTFTQDRNLGDSLESFLLTLFIIVMSLINKEQRRVQSQVTGTCLARNGGGL